MEDKMDGLSTSSPVDSDTPISSPDATRTESADTQSDNKAVKISEQTEKGESVHEKLPKVLHTTLNIPKDRKILDAPDEPESFDEFLERMGVETEELMTEEEKEELFGDAIAQMQEMANERGITLPDDLLSRIHILDIHAFDTLYRRNANAAPRGLNYGVTFPNGHVALNYWDIKGISSERDPALSFTTLLKKFGIHELWHSVQQKNSYERTSEDEEDWYGTNPPISRRSGLRVKGVTWNNVSEGMDLLNEGYVDYLAETTMERQGIKPGYSPYAEQVGIIRTLMKDIGEAPFIEAAFHTDGIPVLSDALDEKFGMEALPQIAVRVKADGDWSAEGYQYSRVTRDFITDNHKRAV